MPFLNVQFEGDKVITSSINPLKPSEIPVFFIPGILGNGTEFQDMIELLREQGESRPFYVWYDPLIMPDKKHSYKENATLDDQGKLIAECMKEFLPEGPAPYVMVGYSYGCSLAAKAAQQLKKQSIYTVYTKLYQIDGPSPECSHKYFATTSEKLTQDLLSIVNYASRLSPHKKQKNNSLHESESDYVFSKQEIEALQYLPPLTLIDAAAKLLLEKRENIDVVRFKKFIAIGKQGIKNLIDEFKAFAHPETQPLDKIVTLVTESTANKYGDGYGGWNKYTHTLSLVLDDRLRSQEHTKLLQESDKLTHSIKSFIHQELRAEVLLPLQLNYLYEIHSFSQEKPPEQLKDFGKLLKANSTKTTPISISPGNHSNEDETFLSECARSNLSSPVDSFKESSPFPSDDEGQLQTIFEFSDEDEENKKLDPKQFFETLSVAENKLKRKVYKNSPFILFPNHEESAKSKACPTSPNQTLEPVSPEVLRLVKAQ